jgi:hypothetical protein
MLSNYGETGRLNGTLGFGNYIPIKQNLAKKQKTAVV